MKNFFKEFKEFISRGNIIDLAIGVIIGGAFSAIVNSLVNDIIMPCISLATGGSIENLSVVLNGVDKLVLDTTTGTMVLNPEATLLYYGKFIQAILNFLIIAICLFIGLKIVISVKKAAENRRKAEEVAAPVEEAPAGPTQEELLAEIRDLLKAQQSQVAKATEKPEETEEPKETQEPEETEVK